MFNYHRHIRDPLQMMGDVCPVNGKCCLSKEVHFDKFYFLLLRDFPYYWKILWKIFHPSFTNALSEISP